MPFQIIVVFSEELLKFAQQFITRTVNDIEEFPPFHLKIPTALLNCQFAFFYSFNIFVKFSMSLMSSFFSLFFYKSPLLTIDQILNFL